MFTTNRFITQWFRVIRKESPIDSLRPFFEHGISPNTKVSEPHDWLDKESREFTLLTMACGGSVPSDIRVSLVRLLLEFDVDVNEYDPYGRCGLWCALSNSNNTLSLLLAEHGAEVEEVMIECLITNFVPEPNHLEKLVATMIQTGVLMPYLNLPFDLNSDNSTILHQLVTRSKGYHHIETTLRCLDKAGVDWNLQDKYGDTVLHSAFNMTAHENERFLPELWLVDLLLFFEPRQVVMENNQGDTAISYFHDTLELLIFLDSEEYMRDLRHEGYCEEDEEWSRFLQQRELEIRQEHQPLLDLLLRVQREVLSA
jgi:hypothetical protein